VTAVPFAYFHATINDKDVNVVAAGDDASANLNMKSGRHIEAEGEAVADQHAGLDVGDTTDVAGVPMEIVGISKGTTFNFGVPTVFVPIADAQKMLFAGQPVATAFMIEGESPSAPTDMRVMTLSEVVKDMKRPIKQGADSILFINVLLWIVAAGIIGSIVYLSSLERASDFAVLKATGTSTGSLVAGLALQAVILCAASALVAALLAQPLKAGFPFEVDITAASYVTLPVVAILVGLVASLAGLRRTVAVDPALAFG
jgi:putative ABC transport system permease protein